MALDYIRDDLERRVNLFGPFGGEVLLEVEYMDGKVAYKTMTLGAFAAFNHGPKVEVPDIRRVNAYKISMRIKHLPSGSFYDNRMVVDWDAEPLDTNNLNIKALLEPLDKISK